MPATPAIASKTVTGTYVAPDGSPAAGTLRFIPSATVQDVTGHIVVAPFPLEVDLDEDGHFSIELSVTDDPDAEPQNWTWHLTELLAITREVDFLLPSAGPSTVDISTILPASDVVASYQYASIVQVNEALDSVAASVAGVEVIEDDLNARMDQIDLDSAVVTAAVVVHPFLVMGA